MIPPHYLHLYQKPKVGNNFIQQHMTYNYRHQISANGWYDTASCDLVLPPIQAEIALENWVGNPVKIFVDNPSEPIWEGIITTVGYDSGDVLVRRSLDSMMNRAEVVIQLNRLAVGSQVNITNAANLTPSQAIYGVKEGSINADVKEGSAITNRPESLRDTLVAVNGWPQVSITQGRRTNLHIEMQGYYHTLEWEMHWVSANTGLYNASVLITRLLSNITNTNLWFDNSDTSGVETNTTWNELDQIRIGMTKWDGFRRVTEAGNASTASYFIVGIEPTNLTTGLRRLYYRTANSAVEYTAWGVDGLRVRNASGGLIRPWTMIPDRVLRITDVLTGWDGKGDDPRDVYLRSIEYDAERQTLRWQGSDNTTGEGVFQVTEFYQRHDKKWSTSKWLTRYI